MSNNNRRRGQRQLPRVNEQIRAMYVELIDEKGQHYESYNTQEAIQRAFDLNLSLVEIRFDKIKPICKIMDYGKFQYEKSKQESVNRMKQKQVKEKEIQISSTTSSGDLARLIKQAREMLEEGNKLRIVLSFKGRTIVHRETYMANLNQMLEALADVSKVFQQTSNEGRKSIVRLIPVINKPSTE